MLSCGKQFLFLQKSLEGEAMFSLNCVSFQAVGSCFVLPIVEQAARLGEEHDYKERNVVWE